MKLISLSLFKYRFLFPVKSEMRELVYQLSYEYPNMFRGRQWVLISYQYSNHVYLEGTVAKHPVDRVETLSNKMMHRVK